MSYEQYRQQFEGDSFNDILVDQLRKAPWFFVSIALHGVIFMLVLWLSKGEKQEKELVQAEVVLEDEIPEEEEEEEEEPEEEEPEPEEMIEDPVEVDEEVDEHDEDETNEEYEEIRGEEDVVNDKPMDATSNNDAIGLGGGAGGAFGGRRGGRARHRKGRGRRGQQVVDRGLEWLSRHQSKEGNWDADDYHKNGDPKLGPLCEGGKGGPLYDVGVSGLSLLAFLGAGETHKAGKYRQTVRKGLTWLKSKQDGEGCFGPRTAPNFTYNHAIGALAMCEAYGLTRAPIFKRPAEKAIEFVVACQNPYKAWRYGEADGDNDTSVTGWMVMALKSAKAAGIEVDPKCFEWALGFIEEMTDEENGRTGYLQRGSLPVREGNKLEEFPSAESESLTAVGILTRVFAGQNPEENAAIKLGADLLVEKLPLWDESRGSIDMYYWYYGTLAMFQVGGSGWNAWNAKMKEAVIETQRSDGNYSGSWDPIGAWGENGGRVYSTALQTLCLEVYYRYGKVFGAN